MNDVLWIIKITCMICRFKYFAIIPAIILLAAVGVANANEPQGSKSLSAYNHTQGTNAESVAARPGDLITYTLTFQSNLNGSQSFVFADNIEDILYSAEINNYGGASLSSNVLSYPAVSVPANARVQKSFQVRVREIPAGTKDLLMSNFYGNGVDVRIFSAAAPTPTPTPMPAGQVKGAYLAPATGSGLPLVALLASILTMFWFFISSRRKILAVK